MTRRNILTSLFAAPLAVVAIAKSKIFSIKPLDRIDFINLGLAKRMIGCRIKKFRDTNGGSFWGMDFEESRGLTREERQLAFENAWELGKEFDLSPQ